MKWQLYSAHQFQYCVRLTPPEFWTMPALDQLRLLPILKSYLTDFTFTERQIIHRTRQVLHCDLRMEVDESLDVVDSASRYMIPKREPTTMIGKSPPMDWTTGQTTVSIVAGGNMDSAIRCGLYGDFLGMGPTGDAKFFPDLALVLAINAKRIVGCGRSDIWAHHWVLISIDATITDDTLNANGPFKAEQVTMPMSRLMFGTDWPDIHHEIMTVVANDHIPRLLKV